MDEKLSPDSSFLSPVEKIRNHLTDLKRQTSVLQDLLSSSSIDQNLVSAKIKLAEDIVTEVEKEVPLYHADQTTSSMAKERMNVIIMQEISFLRSLTKKYERVEAREKGILIEELEHKDSSIVTGDWDGDQQTLQLAKQHSNLREEAEKIGTIKDNAVHLKSMMVRMNELIHSQGSMLDEVEGDMVEVQENMEGARGEVASLTGSIWAKVKSNIWILVVLLLILLFILFLVFRKAFV